MSTLMAIGGAIDWQDPLIPREFIRRAGGSSASILVIPAASSQADSGEFYRQRFAALGAGEVSVLDVCQRAQANDAAHLERLRRASAVFFSGGNQARLPALLGGTLIERELLAAYSRGAIVAGTSAGAAALSRVMLAFGKSGPSPRHRIAQFVAGLGFTDRIIFDQHFRQRDRLGRLLYIVASHPALLGVGVDENTAAIVTDDTLEVLGANTVTIVDGSTITATDIADVSGHRPIAVSGVCLHVLTQGCSFHLESRQAVIPEKILPVD